MKLTDGGRIVEIKMRTWDGNSYSPDWSNDFFVSGLLDYNEDLEAFNVPDVAYCIDQAYDWKNNRGDFYDGSGFTNGNADVEVEELEFPPLTKDDEYVTCGMWLTDSTGFYEVRDVSADRVEAVEILFEDEGDDFSYGGKRIFTRWEISRIGRN